MGVIEYELLLDEESQSWQRKIVDSVMQTRF